MTTPTTFKRFIGVAISKRGQGDCVQHKLFDRFGFQSVRNEVFFIATFLVYLRLLPNQPAVSYDTMKCGEPHELVRQRVPLP